MPTIIPSQEGLPEIHLFSSVKELREQLGHAYTHGLYDKEKNRIYATYESLSHEIAHFRDYVSGQMPSPDSISDPVTRRRARIRNEIVAIMFSWIKTREISKLPEHEKRFLEWLYFMIDSGRLTPDEPLELMSFKKLQSFAERIMNEAQEQERVLVEIFKHYLKEEERPTGPSERNLRRA